ncbi:FxDxF family PEP-CTERM protein [Sphingomonas crocodyli]|uniref:PEP-CTERM sorting domain-containing protein n=1 Tax=Sphingomonas crocodyli TaxID=1979270 RepID=A0A437LXW6_9SPHN|nr:FxDxF family PEP-CTERM protein [Sphingomonas crocodyli]RVT90166.1 PEP-CTERM sorting domain-containing protein [Sphingomonas crocodyli]
MAIGVAGSLTFSVGAHGATFPAADLHLSAGANGDLSGFFGNSGLSAGDFTDTYTFVLDFPGIGNASVITTTTLAQGPTDLDILSLRFNDIVATPVAVGTNEYAFTQGVQIVPGATNRIVIQGMSRGNGSYAGTLTVRSSAAPEPTTWAMMLIGFGAVGLLVRRSQQRNALSCG